MKKQIKIENNEKLESLKCLVDDIAASIDFINICENSDSHQLVKNMLVGERTCGVFAKLTKVNSDLLKFVEKLKAD